MKVLILAALATLALGSTAASADPEAILTDKDGGTLTEVSLSRNHIIICDRNTDHRYAMAKVRYNGHTYQYANYYKDEDCIEQKTRTMAHGKIEFWACVSKPYKVKFAWCGPKQTIIRH